MKISYKLGISFLLPLAIAGALTHYHMGECRVMGREQEKIFLQVLTAAQDRKVLEERPPQEARAAAWRKFTAARNSLEGAMERLMLVQYGFAAAMLLLALFTAKALLFPIAALAAASRRLREGRLGETVPARGRDELGALTEAFNDMSRGLKDREVALLARGSELAEALRNVKTLSGLLPICAACKRIRDDNGCWHKLESYIAGHSGARFTHGVCPECARKLYPDFSDG